MTNLKSGNKHMHGFVKSKEIRERERENRVGQHLCIFSLAIATKV